MEKAVERIFGAGNRASASLSSAAGVFRRPSLRNKAAKAAGSEVYAAEEHVQVEWDEIPSSSNDRPKWVLVLNKRGKQGTLTDRAIRALGEFVVRDKKGGVLAIFSWKESITDEFKTAFHTKDSPFQTDVVYQRHINPNRTEYYPVETWSYEMNQQRHEELFNICNHLVAEKIEVVYSTDDFAKARDSHGADLFLPVAVPLPNGLVGGNPLVAGGGGFSQFKANEQNKKMESLVFVQNSKPRDALLPEDRPLDEFYFLQVKEEEGGYSQTFKKFVMCNLTGINRRKELTIDLAVIDQSRHEYSANANLIAKIIDPAKTRGIETPVAGVAYRAANDRFDLAKVRYSYKVTMFSEEVYQKMKRYSIEMQSQLNKENWRKSLDIATLRWRNHRIMPRVRQDLVHAKLDAVPEGECSKRVSSRLSFRGYVQEVIKSGSNTLTVPITLYGLKGSGKSSVLGTWESGARDTPYSFMVPHGSWRQYKNRVQLPSMRSTFEDVVIPNLVMDSRKDMDKEGNRLPGRLPKDMFEFDQCKFEFNDSAPAVSMYKVCGEDGEEDDLPFGLLVLVVSARRLEEVITSSKVEEEEKIELIKKLSKAFASGDSKSVEKDIASCDNKWSDLVSDDGSYPPAACIIAGTNHVNNSASTPEVLQAAFSAITGVKNVVTMPTFAVPSQDELDRYVRSGISSDVCREYNMEWKRTMRQSLEALNHVLEYIKHHESSKIRDVLDEEAEKYARDEADWNKYLATLKSRAPFGAAAAVASVVVVGAAAYMSTVEEE